MGWNGVRGRVCAVWLARRVVGVGRGLAQSKRDGRGGGFVGDDLGIGVALHECGGIGDGHLASDGAAEDSAMAFASSAVEADFARGENFAHSQGDGHGGNCLRIAAGATDGLDDDGIGSEGNDASLRLAEFFDADCVPARERRFVEGDVPVIADAAVAEVDASGSVDAGLDGVGHEGVGEVELVQRHAQILVDAIDDVAAHEAAEAERVLLVDEASLPVEPFVHLKNVDVLPGNAMAVGQVD